MNITKVKVEGARIHIKWTTPSKTGSEPDEHILRSNETPRPEFIEAMLGLRQAIVVEAELPEEMIEQITPRGVSLKTYADGRMGAVISGTRALENSNSPLVLNTPLKADEGANETDPTPLLSDVTREAVDEVVREAVKYIQGERAQQELLLEEKAPRDGIPTIHVDMGRKCSRCGEPGATQGGLCLECVGKQIGVPEEEPVAAG